MAGRIVVGVDGSAGSRTALEWALSQARSTGATVDVVGVWQVPTVNEYSYRWPAEVFDHDTTAAITGKIVADVVAEAQGTSDPLVLVETRAVQGHPAEVLTEAATGAQLLVVGNRGHGAFAGMLLGSVSQHCVQHATCPVVVVPAKPSDHGRRAR